jgi:dolichol-phosphate mannosyltransferase
MKSIVITMPIYNEEQGVGEFIDEIFSFLTSYKIVFIVVNDCSTDRTIEKIEELRQRGIEIQLLNNQHNVGHGMSTRRGLEEALNLKSDLIISVDGDGQFLGEEIAEIIKISIENPGCVVEGVRKNRSEPYYRKIVTNLTRVLVMTRTFKPVGDANTPLRAYPPVILRKILGLVPNKALIPNLFISVISRLMKIEVIERDVTSLSRRGQTSEGVTWGHTRRNVPPKRYVVFCLKAIRQWTVIYSRSFKLAASRLLNEES